MSQQDPRPPLRLTRSEAATWMSLHSEDRGREIIIIDWKPAELPYEVVDAHRALGRWETGLYGGGWPQLAMFSGDFLKRPPRYVQVTDYGVVRFALGWGVFTYDLRRPISAVVGETVRLLRATLPDDRYIGVYCGGAYYGGSGER